MAPSENTKPTICIHLINDVAIEFSLGSMKEATALMNEICRFGKHDTQRLFYLHDIVSDKRWVLNLQHIVLIQIQ